MAASAHSIPQEAPTAEAVAMKRNLPPSSKPTETSAPLKHQPTPETVNHLLTGFVFMGREASWWEAVFNVMQNNAILNAESLAQRLEASAHLAAAHVADQAPSGLAMLVENFLLAIAFTKFPPEAEESLNQLCAALNIAHKAQPVAEVRGMVVSDDAYDIAHKWAGTTIFEAGHVGNLGKALEKVSTALLALASARHAIPQP